MFCPPYRTGFRYLCALYVQDPFLFVGVWDLFSRKSFSRTWNWQLSLSLQEGGVGVDELVGWDIADGDTRHDCGIEVLSVVEVGAEVRSICFAKLQCACMRVPC